MKELTDQVAALLANHEQGKEKDRGDDEHRADQGTHEDSKDRTEGLRRAATAKPIEDLLNQDDGERDGESKSGRQSVKDEDGDRQEQDDEQQGEHEGTDEETNFTGSLDDIAKALGLSRTELNAVEVQIGPHKMSLGELKAKLPELVKLEDSRLEFEQRREVVELEQIDAHRRILALVDTIPRESIPPALLRHLEAQHLETRDREASLLMQARPQWQDPKYSTAEKEAMTKVGRRYGFSNAELASIVDHRQVLLLQDFSHAIARIDAAKLAARKVEPGSDKQLKPETTRAASDSRDRPHGVSKKAHVAQRVAQIISRG